MIAKPTIRVLPLAAFAFVTMLFMGAGVARAAEEAPVKEILASHIGAEVNKTAIEKGASQAQRDICTTESKDECQPAVESEKAGGFTSAHGIAVNNDPSSPTHGDIYIADTQNHRVQVLSPTGAFVLMFGWDVNKTSVDKDAPQTERNICTAASKDECQAGTNGSEPEQLGELASITVDPVTGEVDIAEQIVNETVSPYTLGERVQRFTTEGRFVLEIGKEVNATTKLNTCTAAEEEKAGAVCKAAKQRPLGSPYEWGNEHGAFNFAQSENVIVVGGPEDLLYVGDEHRVQEFNAEGEWQREISLDALSAVPENRVGALAVDAAGDVYLAAYGGYHGEVGYGDVVHEFAPGGEELKHTELLPRGAGGEEVAIVSMAVDPAGDLAITENEAATGELVATIRRYRGSLYEVQSAGLHLVTEFPTKFYPVEDSFDQDVAIAIAFASDGGLYAVSGQEVDSYLPFPVAGLSVSPASCVPGAEDESDATFDCTLTGAVNPWKVSETSVFFQFGDTIALGSQTVAQPVSEIEPGKAVSVSAALGQSLPPNSTVYYRLAGYDHNVEPPESALTSTTGSFRTETVPPRVVGEPSASFVRSSSVDMFAELNPENDNTTYYFQYGACPEGLTGCATLMTSSSATSSEYGDIATTLEAVGLQPDTVYRYRLVAVNEKGQESAGPEASFTTSPAALPQAATGVASAVAATSATISGTVDADGQAATYMFELGRYNPSGTVYGVVLSGSAGAGESAVYESLGLSDLQPGTTYAYRIAIREGTGEVIHGEPVTFTTSGLPAVLSLPATLAQLPVPDIAFPTALGPAKTLTKAKIVKKKTTAHKKKRKAKKAKKAVRRRGS